MSMDNHLQVTIISQAKSVLTCKASLVTMLGEDGQFGVMPMHAKLIANLVPGIITITDENNELLKYFLYKSVAKICDNKLQIITDFAFNINDPQELSRINARLEQYKILLAESKEELYTNWLNQVNDKDTLAASLIHLR